MTDRVSLYDPNNLLTQIEKKSLLEKAEKVMETMPEDMTLDGATLLTSKGQELLHFSYFEKGSNLPLSGFTLEGNDIHKISLAKFCMIKAKNMIDKYDDKDADKCDLVHIRNINIKQAKKEFFEEGGYGR